MSLKKLQNGSDIRGVAVGADANLTEDAVRRITVAFTAWLTDKTGVVADSLSVSVGRDSRTSGPLLAQWVTSALCGAGVRRVASFGLASTPAMFMSTVTPGDGDEKEPFTGAIMLTASHLPGPRNGLKFFTAQGGLEKADIKDIIAAAEALEPAPVAPAADVIVVEEVDFMTVYKRQLVEKVREAHACGDRPLEGFRVLVDAGNGAGGFFADILRELGADTTGSQFLDPDGTFPHHTPNPEDDEAMDSICAAVRATDGAADLGVILDTDVDRAAIVARDGRAINRNRFIAVMAAVVLERWPGSTIVTDSVTSTGLHKFIKKHGGRHHRFKRGYRNVINEAREMKGEAHLAIETSGHGALSTNYWLDDGAYLVVELLASQHYNKLHELIEDLEEPAESEEHRFKIIDEDFVAAGERIVAAIRSETAERDDWELDEPNHEGVRVNVAPHKGWFLARISLHDPVLVLNIESDIAGGNEAIRTDLLAFLRKQSGVDVSEV